MQQFFKLIIFWIKSFELQIVFNLFGVVFNNSNTIKNFLSPDNREKLPKTLKNLNISRFMKTKTVMFGVGAMTLPDWPEHFEVFFFVFFFENLFFFSVVFLKSIFFHFVFFMLENNCKFVAYNWLQISCINTLLLINSTLLLLFLFVTNYNLQTLNVLCSFIISVWFIMNVESFVFLRFFV